MRVNEGKRKRERDRERGSARENGNGCDAMAAGMAGVDLARRVTTAGGIVRYGDEHTRSPSSLRYDANE